LVTYRAARYGAEHRWDGGRLFADVFLYLFGFLAVLFPIMVGYSGWLIFRGRTQDGDIDYNTLALRWLGFLLTLGAGCGLASLHFKLGSGVLPLSAGASSVI